MKNFSHSYENYGRPTQTGVTTILVVVFMGVFLVIMSALVGFTLEESKYGTAIYAREQSLAIAESGLEYYRWLIGHNMQNSGAIMTTGAGLSSLPGTYTVTDSESGGAIGTATITATANLQCGAVQSIDITSKGVSNASPLYPRTLSVRYMAPSITQYSAVNATNVHYGNEVIVGPVTANGGIRMDGTSSSTISSALSTVYCDNGSSGLGCDGVGSDPSPQWEPGVFGPGQDSRLWQYPPNSPVANVNFAAVPAALPTIETDAQASGIYLSGTKAYVNGVQQGSSYQSVSGANTTGFHIILNSDGSFDAYAVTSASWVYGYPVDGSSYFRQDYDIIGNQTYIGHFTPSSSCGLVYVQGTLWLEGTAKGKFTILAADPIDNFSPDIILSNNLTYATNDGTTGLTVIAQHSVRVPINSPDTMTVRGILVAATGYWGRDYYTSNSAVYQGYVVPSAYNSYVTRTQLTNTGTVMSAEKPILYWGDSGYISKPKNYDQVLAFNPPPFTPTISTNYGFVLWQER